MTRRIVQIIQSPAAAREILALCDDGTVQRGQFSGSGTDERFQWFRRYALSPVPQDAHVEPDPIAELEAMGGAFYRDPVRDGVRWGVCFNQTWLYEVIGERCDSARLRAAAARLLARVRGAK